MDDTGLRALLIVSIVSAAAPFACALLSRFCPDILSATSL